MVWGSGSMVRLESSVAPRILTLSESWMSVPVTLQDFRPEKDFSLLGVPNRMATDFVGLRAIPFFTEPNTKRVQARLKCRNVLAVIGWQKSNIELRVVRVLLLSVEFYLYPTVSTALVHSVKPKLTEQDEIEFGERSN